MYLCFQVLSLFLCLFSQRGGRLIVLQWHVGENVANRHELGLHVPHVREDIRALREGLHDLSASEIKSQRRREFVGGASPQVVRVRRWCAGGASS